MLSEKAQFVGINGSYWLSVGCIDPDRVGGDLEARWRLPGADRVSCALLVQTSAAAGRKRALNLFSSWVSEGDSESAGFYFLSE